MEATKTGGINTTRTKSLTNHSLALVNNSFVFAVKVSVLFIVRVLICTNVNDYFKVCKSLLIFLLIMTFFE